MRAMYEPINSIYGSHNLGWLRAALVGRLETEPLAAGAMSRASGVSSPLRMAYALVLCVSIAFATPRPAPL